MVEDGGGVMKTRLTHHWTSAVPENLNLTVSVSDIVVMKAPVHMVDHKWNTNQATQPVTCQNEQASDDPM